MSDLTNEPRAQANQHPLDADLQMFDVAATRIEELEADVKRLAAQLVLTQVKNVERIDDLKEVCMAMREYIDALPKDLVLPAMPGFDRDWADSIIDANTVSLDGSRWINC